MTDICRDAAVFFDGEDPADIARKLLEVLADRPLREMLARRGPARAAQFSWLRGAESVHEVLQPHRLPGADDRSPAAIHPERRI